MKALTLFLFLSSFVNKNNFFLFLSFSFAFSLNSILYSLLNVVCKYFSIFFIVCISFYQESVDGVVSDHAATVWSHVAIFHNLLTWYSDVDFTVEFAENSYCEFGIVA